MPSMNFSSYLDDFRIGFTKVYEDEYRIHEKTYTAYLQEMTAETWFQKDWVVSGLEIAPEKPIGQPYVLDELLPGPTKEFDLKVYGLAVVIDNQAIYWDQYGIFRNLPQKLAKSMVLRYLVLGYSPLNNSFAAPNAQYQIYSGENIISATHSRLDLGTWSNAVAGNPGLSYLGLQSADIVMANTVDQRGNPIIFEPQRVICSRDNRWIAQELTMSRARPDQDNPAVYNSVTGLDVHSSVYLTNAQYWWLQSKKTDMAIGMRLGRRPQIDKDQDIRTSALTITSFCETGMYTFDSRGIVGSTGAGV